MVAEKQSMQFKPVARKSRLFSIEKHIATLLLDKLERGEITTERAAEIARSVLVMLTGGLSDKRLLDSISTLSGE